MDSRNGNVNEEIEFWERSKLERYERVHKLVIKAQISIEEEKMEIMLLRVAWVNSKVLLAYCEIDVYL